MKLRSGESRMPAEEYGRSHRGPSVNPLVADVARSVAFQTEVLGVEVVYGDPDFAALRDFGGEWMLHADHAYADHPLRGCLSSEIVRGDVVLAGAGDKPHGLREAFLVDPYGDLWVSDVPTRRAWGALSARRGLPIFADIGHIFCHRASVFIVTMAA